ncbi:hypothetical protein HA402_015287 [Bradysia odoriphaga]|nr:hypothetical protein HA402_015287 [Bradysia odoriphaga]
MASIIRLQNSLLSRCILANASKNYRLISTSPKNRETASIAPNAVKEEAKVETKSKNWVSYGFSYTDKKEDRDATRSSFFFAVTMCIVWGSFVWAYLPDTLMRDWAQREGYLTLRQREAAGLEPISRDLIDPSLITLPSDEELGDTEIII